MRPVTFNLFIPGEETKTLLGSPLWNTSLSGKKRRFSPYTDSRGEFSGFSIGEYFQASVNFLSKNDFHILKSGLSSKFDKNVQKIRRIDIFLEKHGAFYHPLKIKVLPDNESPCLFVLNGAVSEPGLSLVDNEYRLLSKMAESHSRQYVPKVFGKERLSTQRGPVSFFLGEWFEGYREFHVSEVRNEKKIRIWKSDGRTSIISMTEASAIYEKISRILTYYYNIETLKEIFPWHHSAGDFVVKQSKGTFYVKLISVRGYSPLMGSGSDSKNENILPFLLFFFLNLTLRMQIDRLDGTGRTIFLGESILRASVKGFLKALDEKSESYDLRACFVDFFRKFDPDQIKGILLKITDSYNQEYSEISVIRKNLESHSKNVHAICS